MPEHTCGGRGPAPCPACTLIGAQAAFVQAWRAAHPNAVYTTLWTCELCGMVVQTAPNLRHAEYGPQMVEVHQRQHGSAWLVYQQAGQPQAEREGQGGQGD